MNRTDLERRLLDFAEVAIMIWFNTPVKTAIGTIDLIGAEGLCMQDINGDWVIHGTIHNLTDEDFIKVYDAACEKAKEILQMSE